MMPRFWTWPIVTRVRWMLFDYAKMRESFERATRR